MPTTIAADRMNTACFGVLETPKLEEAVLFGLPVHGIGLLSPWASRSLDPNFSGRHCRGTVLCGGQTKI